MSFSASKIFVVMLCDLGEGLEQSEPISSPLTEEQWFPTSKGRCVD